MGDIVEIICRKCDYRKKIQLGVGREHHYLENVLDIVPFRKRKEIQEILRKCKVIEKDYEHRLYNCSQCNGFHGRFHVRVVYIDNDESRVCETKYICPKCKKELNPVEEGVEKLPCPICKEKTLLVDTVALWD